MLLQLTVLSENMKFPICVLLIFNLAMDHATAFTTDRFASDMEEYPVLRQNPTVTDENFDSAEDLEPATVRELLTEVYSILQDERNAFDEMLATITYHSNTEKVRLDRITEMIKNYIRKEQHGIKTKSNSLRRHQKRSAFDSISHGGGLSSLGNTESGRREKLPFTFENLLPYLLKAQRRNGRAVARRRH